MTIERRRSKRVPAPAGTEGVLRSTVHVKIRNISSDGVQLQVTSPLRPGTMYALQAQLPDLTLNTQVRVTRCKAGGYGTDQTGTRVLLYSAGAEFVWLDEAGPRELAIWLLRRSAEELYSLEGLLAPPPG